MRTLIVTTAITLLLATSGVALADLEEIAPNTAPVASADALQVAEDGTASVLTSANDADGDALSYIIVTPPSHGFISGVGPAWTYSPLPDYHGADSFTFVVSDGQAQSAPVTVAVAVASVEDAPVASDAAFEAIEDGSAHVELAATDADGDAITYEIQDGPAHGQLSGHAPSLVYTPDADFAGTDSFTYIATDGGHPSAPATITVTVAPVNDAPSATPTQVSVQEDGSTAFTLPAQDVDGDELTYTITLSPEFGELSGEAPDLVYTPAADFFGRDTLVFEVSDGETSSAPAVVSIDVAAVADAPTAEAQVVGADEDTAVSIALGGFDADEDALAFVIVSGPQHGELSGAGDVRSYHPAANFNGADSFTYLVDDGSLSSEPATIEIFVAPVNDVPQTAPIAAQTDEDEPVAIDLSATDVDGDEIEVSVIVAPSHGQLVGTPPNVVYIPAPDFQGIDTFSFNATDGSLASAPTLVTIDVVGANDAPRVEGGLFWDANEDSPLSIVLPGSDADGDALTFTITAPPAHGTLTGSGAHRIYQPAANFNGTDTFAYTVSDGQQITGQQVGTITVVAQPDAPVAFSDTHAVGAEGVTIVLRANDPDGDALTYEVLADPSNGWVDGTPPNVFYKPFPGFEGTDQLVFQVSDGSQLSVPQTISLVVEASIPKPQKDEEPTEDPQIDSEDLGDAGDAAPTHGDSDSDTDDQVKDPSLGSLVLVFCPDTIDGAPCDADRWQPIADEHGTPSSPVHFSSYLPEDMDDFRLVYFVRHGRDLTQTESDMLREFTADQGGRIVVTVDRDDEEAVERANRWLAEDVDLGVQFDGGSTYASCMGDEAAHSGADLSARPLYLDVSDDEGEVVAATDDGVLAVAIEGAAGGDYVVVADESVLAGTCGDNGGFIDALYTFEPLATSTDVEVTATDIETYEPTEPELLAFNGGCSGAASPTAHLAWLLALACMMVRARRRRHDGSSAS